MSARGDAAVSRAGRSAPNRWADLRRATDANGNTERTRDVTMRRRELIGFAGAALFVWPGAARAQSQLKVARLGYLGFGPPAASAARVQALRAGLRDLGYVEGKNLVIEFRWAGTVEQLNEAAAELARMKVDVIFATSSTESESARRATGTIPIVFATHADPESAGHVA